MDISVFRWTLQAKQEAIYAGIRSFFIIPHNLMGPPSCSLSPLHIHVSLLMLLVWLSVTGSIYHPVQGKTAHRRVFQSFWVVVQESRLIPDWLVPGGKSPILVRDFVPPLTLYTHTFLSKSKWLEIPCDFKTGMTHLWMFRLCFTRRSGGMSRRSRKSISGFVRKPSSPRPRVLHYYQVNWARKLQILGHVVGG